MVRTQLHIFIFIIIFTQKQFTCKTRDMQQVRSRSKHETVNSCLNKEVPETGYHCIFAADIRSLQVGLVPRPRDGTELIGRGGACLQNRNGMRI